jgi:predicted ester cyclase
MSTQANEAIVRRIFDDIYNQGNLAAVDEIFAANYVDHSAPPGFPAGLESFKQSFGMFRAAFPDIHVAVEDEIAVGDKVVVRLTFNGTHTGPLMGMPPTNKFVSITGIAIDRVENGKVVEHWVNRDDLGMLQQLGMIPAM